MPDVYLPSMRIPELHGVVKEGISVVLHRPEEIDLIYALASIAPRPPASPLKSLGEALADPRLDLFAWHKEWLGRDSVAPTPTYGLPAVDAPVPFKRTEQEADDLTDLAALRDVLIVLKHLWTSDPEDVPLMSCVVTLPAPTMPEDTGLSWETTTSNLTFGRGSLNVWLGRGARRAAGFLAGLVLGGGIDAAARAPHLVDRARWRALRRLADPTRPLGLAGQPVLRALGELAPEDVANRTLVVLVHGLCSTDVGTFGEFEAQLRERPNVLVAGFAHDSLTTPVRQNAKELAQLLCKLGKRDVRLVCHSRGGLVARQAYLFLKAKHAPGDEWIHSCVTFGTPHLGTSVASSPETLTALVMAGAHVGRSPGAASLVDVLCGASDQGFVGVSELAPPAVAGSYLEDLERQENQLFLDDGLTLRVFGSLAPRSTLWTRLGTTAIERILGTSQHDLLVPTSSSLPPLNAAAIDPLPNRTHFEYFTRIAGEAAAPAHFAVALAALQV